MTKKHKPKPKPDDPAQSNLRVKATIPVMSASRDVSRVNSIRLESGTTVFD